MTKKPNGYWTEDRICKELNIVISRIGYFPTKNQLKTIGESKLSNAMNKYGGFQKYRTLNGYSPHKRQKYWTEETTLNELKCVILNIGHFPTISELIALDRNDLIHAIYDCGCVNKFRELLGYSIIIKSIGYWTKENIIKEISTVIKNNNGKFPTKPYLISVNRSDIISAIDRITTIKEIRKEMGYNSNFIIRRQIKTNEIINKIKSLMLTIDNVFPSKTQIDLFDDKLYMYMSNYGGVNYFRRLCGVTPTSFEEYKSNVSSYIGKRGKKTEDLVYNILKEYCITKDIINILKNTKLCKGNIIEFICETNRRIGIDVTNTERKEVVYYKWTKKDYYKYLDELWIVVFSNAFDEEDYIKWNNESPDNVYIYSIDSFIDELQYDLDEATKNTIEKYKSCTFHTRDKFKEQSLNT